MMPVILSSTWQKCQVKRVKSEFSRWSRAEPVAETGSSHSGSVFGAERAPCHRAAVTRKRPKANIPGTTARDRDGESADSQRMSQELKLRIRTEVVNLLVASNPQSMLAKRIVIIHRLASGVSLCCFQNPRFNCKKWWQFDCCKMTLAYTWEYTPSKSPLKCQYIYDIILLYKYVFMHIQLLIYNKI